LKFNAQGKGEVVVSTEKVHLTSQDLFGSALAPGDYALLKIKDTGPGIEEKDLEHIFEPFYSKKTMGRSGTGLALTVVWNTMNDHDGRVRVLSDQEGTCFELFFPLEKNATPSLTATTHDEKLQGNGERILIIDDEAIQRDLASKILEMFGYHVDVAASGEEGLAFLKHHDCDLLILDMILKQGMDGHETYREIVKFRPHQKAIIVSGFSASESVENTQKLGAGELVKKPYSPETLARAAHNALRRSSGAEVH
jgi:CheY-like chemotaxis protein